MLDEGDVQQFDEDFIQPLDPSDNTWKKNLLAMCIADFHPAWNEHTERNEAFDQAVAFAKEIMDFLVELDSV